MKFFVLVDVEPKERVSFRREAGIEDGKVELPGVRLAAARASPLRFKTEENATFASAAAVKGG